MFVSLVVLVWFGFVVVGSGFVLFFFLEGGFVFVCFCFCFLFLGGFARVGNDAKRALCTRMRIVFYAIRLELKTSV